MLLHWSHLAAKILIWQLFVVTLQKPNVTWNYKYHGITNFLLYILGKWWKLLFLQLVQIAKLLTCKVFKDTMICQYLLHCEFVSETFLETIRQPCLEIFNNLANINQPSFSFSNIGSKRKNKENLEQDISTDSSVKKTAWTKLPDTKEH